MSSKVYFLQEWEYVRDKTTRKDKLCEEMINPSIKSWKNEDKIIVTGLVLFVFIIQ